MTNNLRRALLFLYAETPVHAGADTGLGALDLPIQREVTTQLPIIKGESLKGALREHTRPLLDERTWTKMFGALPPRSGAAAGTLSPGELRFHEAQLVAFPAPALDGFAWVTSALARARLDRKTGLAGITPASGAGNHPAGSASPPEDASTGPDSPEQDSTRCLMANVDSKGGRKLPTKQVVLGSYAFTAAGDRGLNGWAQWLSAAALPTHDVHTFFRKRLSKQLYQVPDPVFTAITRECTQVAARVQLGAPDVEGRPTKSVEHGPFYSEYLPSESLLAALLESATPAHLRNLADLIDGEVIQVGGDETIGKGLMWCSIVPAPADGSPPAHGGASTGQAAEEARP